MRESFEILLYARTLQVIPTVVPPPNIHSCLEENFRKGCVIGVYQHKSLMVGYATLPHLPWVDDMQR